MLTKITLALAFAFAVIPGRSGVCWSYDLRVQHVSVRQLWRRGRSLLPLSHAVLADPAKKDDG